MALPRDFEKLTDAEVEAFLDSFDHVLSDCDGVLWHGYKPFPGVGEFFARLKRRGKNVAFVSNNSLRTKEAYGELFKEAGIENGVENLMYPSTAIADYLKKKDLKKKVFCVAAPESRRTLESCGFECVEGPLYGEEVYTDYVKYLKDDPDIGAVVFDSDFRINIPKLYMAATYLKREDVHYVAGATDRIVPFGGKQFCIGPGQFTDMVSEVVKREPIVLAKPGKPFAEYVIDKIGITDPKRVLFIGDMIIQDVGFGKTAGFTTLLVLTGHTHDDMMSNERLRPDYYAPSLTKALERLQK